MDTIKEFVLAFADTFDETPIETFTADTAFHELDDWSSINGLAILDMIKRRYGVKLSPHELRNAVTVNDVYNLILSKE